MFKLKVDKIYVNINECGDWGTHIPNPPITSIINCKDIDEVEIYLEDNPTFNLYERVLDYLETIHVDDEEGEVENTLIEAYMYGFSFEVSVYENNNLVKRYWITPLLKSGRRGMIQIDEDDDITIEEI